MYLHEKTLRTAGIRDYPVGTRGDLIFLVCLEPLALSGQPYRDRRPHAASALHHLWQFRAYLFFSQIILRIRKIANSSFSQNNFHFRKIFCENLIFCENPFSQNILRKSIFFLENIEGLSSHHSSLTSSKRSEDVGMAY